MEALSEPIDNRTRVVGFLTFGTLFILLAVRPLMAVAFWMVVLVAAHYCFSGFTFEITREVARVQFGADPQYNGTFCRNLLPI